MNFNQSNCLKYIDESVFVNYRTEFLWALFLQHQIFTKLGFQNRFLKIPKLREGSIFNTEISKYVFTYR